MSDLRDLSVFFGGLRPVNLHCHSGALDCVTGKARKSLVGDPLARLFRRLGGSTRIYCLSIVAELEFHTCCGTSTL